MAIFLKQAPKHFFGAKTLLSVNRGSQFPLHPRGETVHNDAPGDPHLDNEPINDRPYPRRPGIR